MKNIKPYQNDCYSFFESLLEQKRDEELVSRIHELLDKIDEAYDDHNSAFHSNNLALLQSEVIKAKEKDDLISLYSYRAKRFQELKIVLTTDENNRVNSTCQNCTISEVNSFDHYIPKDEFPLLAVKPKNLFPSCTTCNGHKGTVWREGEKTTFLNLYLDQLPSEQYLFLEITDSNDLDFNFYLDNKKGIDSDLFDVIKYHYSKLKLLTRFKENSDMVISEFELEISSNLKSMSRDTCVETVLENTIAKKKLFGPNYWKLVLIEALVTDEDYMNNIV